MSATHAVTRTGDIAAITLSGLCLVHCLALPVLAVALPILGAWAEAEWIHWLFAALAGPISLWAIWRGHSRLRWPLLGLAAAGVALLFAGAAGFPDHDYETILTVTGGLIIATAHILNLTTHRR